MTRPFRFAVQSFHADSAKEWREGARKIEDLGYSALHLADHIIGPGPALEATNHPLQTLAAVPAMAVAAEATTRRRVGCRVFCIDYRQPAMLAKEAATLDFFSEGRLELGLGAGWLKDEYGAMGIGSSLIDMSAISISPVGRPTQVPSPPSMRVRNAPVISLPERLVAGKDSVAPYGVKTSPPSGRSSRSDAMSAGATGAPAMVRRRSVPKRFP